jgi:hypothetical protein
MRGEAEHGTRWGELEVDGSTVKLGGVLCCLCGRGIVESRLDPVTLNVTANDEEVSQLLWCHGACLRATGASDLRLEFLED